MVAAHRNQEGSLGGIHLVSVPIQGAAVALETAGHRIRRPGGYPRDLLPDKK
jgi:hypothetical protein